ncbi:uncharacterized protein LOC129404428 isoform X2 [Sorex araneus]|uniref:uncharacterized protein LOC129404428 isoform X2 n=1 Tax=Sorex araneus TaxID=42254 RepID=UPI002433CBD1|nr:uncharacterized protein LOC129404428 isoform X2 [Sorex araneus]
MVPVGRALRGPDSPSRPSPQVPRGVACSHSGPSREARDTTRARAAAGLEAGEGPLPAAPAAAGPHQHPRARGAALCGRLSPHARRVSGSHGTVRAPGRGPRHGLWYVCRAERVPGQGPVRRRRRDRAVGQRPSLGPSLPLAVLAAGAPEVAAFMSDEAVAAVPGLPALRYTLKYYLLYLSRVRERAAALSRGSAAGCWTPQKLERALWTWTVGRKLCPDLLPDLSPCPAQGDPDGSCVAGATQ